jgi:hypothetical protein
MKKQIILAAIALGLVTSSFGQGYMSFATTGRSWVYDNFSTWGVSQNGGTLNNINVAFLIANAGSTSLIGAGSPTSNTVTLSHSAWASILTDPNFSLGVNMGTGSTAIVGINTASIARGGFGYLAGAGFQVNGFGNSTANLPVAVYVIAWNNAYATPAFAAAAGAAVGWSSVFTYTLQKDTITPAPFFNTSGMAAFGVSPLLIPEPSSIALAGLGGLSLWLFRRRK